MASRYPISRWNKNRRGGRSGVGWSAALVVAAIALMPAFAARPAAFAGPESARPTLLAAADPASPPADAAPPPPAPSLFSRLIAFFGQFHPLTVQFPIALIVAAALAEILALCLKNDFLSGVARFNLIVAALFGMGTVLLGWSAASAEHWMGNTVEMHRWLGTATGVLLLVEAPLAFVSRRRKNGALLWAYRLLLLVLVAMVSLTGYFGGELVFGVGHYHWF